MSQITDGYVECETTIVFLVKSMEDVLTSLKTIAERVNGKIFTIEAEDSPGGVNPAWLSITVTFRAMERPLHVDGENAAAAQAKARAESGRNAGDPTWRWRTRLDRERESREAQLANDLAVMQAGQQTNAPAQYDDRSANQKFTDDFRNAIYADPVLPLGTGIQSGSSNMQSAWQAGAQSNTTCNPSRLEEDTANFIRARDRATALLLAKQAAYDPGRPSTYSGYDSVRPAPTVDQHALNAMRGTQNAVGGKSVVFTHCYKCADTALVPLSGFYRCPKCGLRAFEDALPPEAKDIVGHP